MSEIKTVGELITELRKFDADMPVKVTDTERILSLRVKMVAQCKVFEVESYMGRHNEIWCEDEEGYDDASGYRAVCVFPA